MRPPKKDILRYEWKWGNDLHKLITKLISGAAATANVCSGSSPIGDLRIDRWPFDGPANLISEMTSLPVRSASCDYVICDPPYSEKRQGKNFNPLINELIRILKPGGCLIFYHTWIPCDGRLKLKDIFIKPNMSIRTFRILSCSIKVQMML